MTCVADTLHLFLVWRYVARKEHRCCHPITAFALSTTSVTWASKQGRCCSKRQIRQDTSARGCGHPVPTLQAFKLAKPPAYGVAAWCILAARCRTGCKGACTWAHTRPPTRIEAGIGASLSQWLLLMQFCLVHTQAAHIRTGRASQIKASKGNAAAKGRASEVHIGCTGVTHCAGNPSARQGRDLHSAAGTHERAAGRAAVHRQADLDWKSKQ